MLIEAKEQSKNNSLSSDSRYWFSLKNKIVKLPGKKLFFFEHTLLIGHFTEQMSLVSLKYQRSKDQKNSLKKQKTGEGDYL